MKISKKLVQAISDAIYEGCDKVREKHIPNLSSRCPDDWSRKETAVFDLIDEAHDAVLKKVREALEK